MKLVPEYAVKMSRKAHRLWIKAWSSFLWWNAYALMAGLHVCFLCSLILSHSRKITLDMWEELFPHSTILLSKNLGQTFLMHHESIWRVSNLNFIVCAVIWLVLQCYIIIHLVPFFPKCKAYTTGTARGDFKWYCKAAGFHIESWWEVILLKNVPFGLPSVKFNNTILYLLLHLSSVSGYNSSFSCLWFQEICSL